MRLPRPLPSVAALALLVLPALAAAQRVAPWERRSAPSVGISASGLYATARSEGGGRVTDGAGFDVGGWLGVSALAIGAGWQRLVQPVADRGVDATYQGVYVEPRLAIAPSGSFTPYLSGRVGFLQQRTPASAGTVATSGRVTSAGAGGGLLVALGPGVHVDLGAQWTYLPTDGDGGDVLTRAFRGGRGHGALLRAGLTLGMDRWGR